MNLHGWSTLPLSLSEKPPVIGITTFGRNPSGEYALLISYIEAIRQAGGLPILLPPGEGQWAPLLSMLDGLVLTGGGDIDPTHYDGAMHPTVYKVDAERDAFELSLARAALDSPLPILGICRGLQILGVVSGASLIPHVPEFFGTNVIHREAQRCPTRHPVHLVPGSRLAAVTAVDEIEVVSWHHQAILKVPAEWRVAAHAPDGLIEALEHRHHPWAIALQWHPEMSLDDPCQQRIFRAFVRAAQIQTSPQSDQTPVVVSQVPSSIQSCRMNQPNYGMAHIRCSKFKNHRSRNWGPRIFSFGIRDRAAGHLRNR